MKPLALMLSTYNTFLIPMDRVFIAPDRQTFRELKHTFHEPTSHGRLPPRGSGCLCRQTGSLRHHWPIPSPPKLEITEPRLCFRCWAGPAGVQSDHTSLTQRRPPGERVGGRGPW